MVETCVYATWPMAGQSGPGARKSRAPLHDILPRGELIAVHSFPPKELGRLEVWDANGQKLWTTSPDKDSVGWVSFSPDGRYLAVSTFGIGGDSLSSYTILAIQHLSGNGRARDSR